jgi:hypothetical protein
MKRGGGREEEEGEEGDEERRGKGGRGIRREDLKPTLFFFIYFKSHLPFKTQIPSRISKI